MHGLVTARFKAAQSAHRLFAALLIAVFAVTASALPLPTPVEAASRTYFVNCSAGSDSHTGLSQSQAWKSLDKANQAALSPGDKLLFARGCTWTGTLKAKWHGTASARITIGAYGSGGLPRFQNGPGDFSYQTYTSVDITGSYLILEYLQTDVVNPPVDPNCDNNPVGFFVGFNFRNPNNTASGGSYNILRYAKAIHAMAGVHFNNNTQGDRVLYSTFTDNNVMNVLTPKSVKATDDIGAWGILLKGRNHEIAYNYFARNQARCTYDTPPQGNAVEIYEAQDSTIHHNTSVNDRVFSELGGSAGHRASGITYAYNLVISNVRDARFIVPRGSGNSFGPTPNTSAYNNTVYFTGAQSQGIVCGAGCTTSILTARNNILWAEEKSIYTDGPIVENHNLYWNSAGAPFVQIQGFSLSSSSRLVNPRFVAAGNGNFRLQSGSPAVDAGAIVGWTIDLDKRAVPQALMPDLGGYERGATTTTAMPSVFEEPVIADTNGLDPMDDALPLAGDASTQPADPEDSVPDWPPEAPMAAEEYLAEVTLPPGSYLPLIFGPPGAP